MFNYDIQDNDNNKQFRKEESNGNAVKGSYGKLKNCQFWIGQTFESLACIFRYIFYYRISVAEFLLLSNRSNSI